MLKILKVIICEVVNESHSGQTLLAYSTIILAPKNTCSIQTFP